MLLFIRNSGGITCRIIFPFITSFTLSPARAVFHIVPEIFISASLQSVRLSKSWNEIWITILFNRNSRGVTLTPDGELLFEKVKAALLLLDEGESSIRHNRSRSIPKLRLGASSTLSKYVLLSHLKDT